MIENEQNGQSSVTPETESNEYQYVDQPQQTEQKPVQNINFADKYRNTPAGKYNDIDELAKGYNSLVQYIGSKEKGDNSLPESYVYNGIYQDSEDILGFYEQEAREIGLNQEQFDKLVGHYESFIDSYESGIEEAANGVQAQYWDDCVSYFGQDMQTVANNADYVIENKIPQYTNGRITTEAIVDFFDRHGIASHPITLTLLDMIAEAYKEGRIGAPSSMTSSRNSSNTTISKIIRDKNNPERNEILMNLYKSYLQ
jgi:hypothetical protein